eukprot:6031-Chlamydomonas_euryale.AAC.2
MKALSPPTGTQKHVLRRSLPGPVQRDDGDWHADVWHHRVDGHLLRDFPQRAGPPAVPPAAKARQAAALCARAPPAAAADAETQVGSAAWARRKGEGFTIRNPITTAPHLPAVPQDLLLATSTSPTLDKKRARRAAFLPDRVGRAPRRGAVGCVARSSGAAAREHARGRAGEAPAADPVAGGCGRPHQGGRGTQNDAATAGTGWVHALRAILCEGRTQACLLGHQDGACPPGFALSMKQWTRQLSNQKWKEKSSAKKETRNPNPGP